MAKPLLCSRQNSRVAFSLLAILACFLLAANVCAAPLAAQTTTSSDAEVGTPLIKNFSPQEYGAGPQNWAIVQDLRGRIYVGNGDDGVLEFDGDHWHRISIPNHSTVRSLSLGPTGHVYVGCVGELGYLAPDTAGRMTYVSLLGRIPAKYRGFADVWRTFATKAGVFFATSNTIFRLHDHKIDAWVSPTSFHVAFWVRGTLYVREVDRGLMQLSNGKLELLPDGARFAKEKLYAVLPWDDIHDAAKGSLLIGTRTKGWFIFDGQHFRPWVTDADATLVQDQIYGAQWLASGKLAVATLQGGLLLLGRDGHLAGHIRQSNGLINDTIFAIFQDRDLGLWLGLDNGIARVDINSPLTFFSSTAGLDGAILSIRHFNGTLYAGTAKGLFSLQDSHEGQARFSRVPGIRDQTWSLLGIGQTLLVGTSHGVYSVGTGAAKLVAPNLSAYVLMRVNSATPRVLIGTDHGVASLSLSHDQWVDEGNMAGTSGEVRSLTTTPDGHIWIGGSDQTVTRITLPDTANVAGRKPLVEHFAVPGSSPDNTGEVNVYTVAGKVRIATFSGVFQFNDAAPHVVLAPAFAQLFPSHREISLLNEDGKGRLWMFTNDISDEVKESGVAIPDKNGAYHWDSGPLRALSGMEVSAIETDQDGVLWLGANNGMYRYDPRQILPKARPLPPLIDQVSSSDGHLLWGGAGTQLPSTLSWSENDLRFAYSSPNNDEASTRRFQVRLQGLSDHWSEWTAETYRNYTNLHEGHYRFQVRTLDSAGEISTPSNYDFSVLPPWYRTWWSYLAYGLILGGLIWLTASVRSARLTRRNQALSRLVSERTRELAESHQNLQHANEALVELAITDSLTGMKNRRYVVDHVENDVATVLRNYAQRELGNPGSDHENIDLLFLMIDIDHFKEVNDTYGHAAGDCVLAQLRSIMKEATRDTDTPVRWGGEEFLVIARFASSEFGLAVADRIRTLVAGHPFDIGNGVTIHRTCSIGFATYPLLKNAPHHFTWEDVVKIADQCLYSAKCQGRNRCVGTQSTSCTISDTALDALTVDMESLVKAGVLRQLESPPAVSDVNEAESIAQRTASSPHRVIDID